MVNTATEKTYEFYINNNNMEDGKPNFTTYNDQPLAAGCMAINLDTKKGYFWDIETQSWK